MAFMASWLLIGVSNDGLLNFLCVGSFYHRCQAFMVENSPKPWILFNCESHVIAIFIK
jgi:hypothetical protein